MHEPALSTPTRPSDPDLPARLAVARRPGQAVLDGTWWPRSDRLEDELPGLDRAVHEAVGVDIAHFSYTLGSWSDRPRTVRAGSHQIKLGWFVAGGSPETVSVRLEDHRRVVLTVLAPGTGTVEAEGALAAVRRDPEPATAEPSAGSPAMRLLQEVHSIADPDARGRAARALEADLTQALAALRDTSVPGAADPSS